MKVSVIIPNYNGSEYLINCVDSLYRQSFKKFSIIIVDNGSTDNSIKIVMEKYKEIKIILLQANYGFSKAVNEGIKISDTDYIVLLNNDTVTEDHWLENLVNCIEKDENIFSCCSKMIKYHEKNKIDDAGDEYTAFGWAYKRGDGVNISKYYKNKKVFSSCAGAAIYRRKVFSEIGYFDEDFFAYMEDVDIGYRANIFGYKNIYCSNAIVYHIGSATSGSRYNKFKVKLASRNNVYIILKNMPLLQIIINMPFIFLGFFIKYIYFYKNGFTEEYKLGIKEGLKNYTKINKNKYNRNNFKNYIVVEINIFLNVLKLFLYKIYDRI